MAMHFDLVDLRLMVHIADANSMTRGAELSFISLPAASTRIKNLEESIGTKLLYRTSQGVTLTPPGQAFVTHARMVLGQIEHLRGDMQEYVRGIKGHVRVFANTTSLSEFLPPVLRHYLRHNPDVNIDLRERPSHDIVRAVTEGQTDIGIVAGLVRTENLETLPYRRDRLVLVLPQGHALASQMQIAFADTLELDYVGLQESTAIHAFLRQASDQLHRPHQAAHPGGQLRDRLPHDRVRRGRGRAARIRRQPPRQGHGHRHRAAGRRLVGARDADLRAQPGGPAQLCAGAGAAAGGGCAGAAGAGVMLL